MGREENAGYQHFIPFLQCFLTKGFFLRVIKSRDCVADLICEVVYYSVENIVGKGENAGYNFLLFQQFFIFIQLQDVYYMMAKKVNNA